MNALKDLLWPALNFLLSPSLETGKELEILFVEDCEEDRNLILPGLKGHHVHVCNTFREAVVTLDTLERIDAAFVDLNLKSGHGMEIVNRVAVQFPDAKVAVVCGSAEPMRPGDKAMVLIKSGRIAKDVKDYLANGNGHGSQINRSRLFILIALLLVFAWLMGEFHWIEAIAAKIRQIAP
jgi:CheY-like chemotaxis protein